MSIMVLACSSHESGQPDSSLKLEAQRASLDAIRNSVAQLAAELLEMQHARAKLRINAADRQQEVKEDQKPKPVRLTFSVFLRVLTVELTRSSVNARPQSTLPKRPTQD